MEFRRWTVLAAALAAGTACGALPERILSGYCCAFIDNGEVEDLPRMHRLIDRMAANGFNSIEVKIQPRGDRALDVSRAAPALKALVGYAHARGLVFQIYLYSLPYMADRRSGWAGHDDARSPVDGLGTTIRDAFLLSDVRSWRVLFPHAADFARLRAEIGFDALKFDIERVCNRLVVSHDHETVAAFAAANGGKSPKDDPKRFRAFFFARMKAAVATFAGDVHALAPDLPLGYMPAREEGEISEIFDAALATSSAPSISDGWDLYNGEGYSDFVERHARLVRERNPNARLVDWMRPDNYTPEDVAVGAYHTASKAYGYSLWSLDMLDDGNAKARGKYPLQPPNETEVVWAAYARANAAVRKDIADGTVGAAVRIPFRPATRRVATLDLSKVTFPSLRPVRDVVADASLGPRLVLREQQTMFLRRRAGEEIAVELEHLAGSKRPCALQYALLDSSGRKLANEAVSPGAKVEFRIFAPAEGMYALVVSGGRGGQAWYGVRISGSWCVDAREGTELFGPQTFAVPGAKSGNPSLALSMTLSEAYRCRVNGGETLENVRREHSAIRLEKNVDVLSFSRHPATSYCQNFRLSFPGGRMPYVFPSADRGMKGE